MFRAKLVVCSDNGCGCPLDHWRLRGGAAQDFQVVEAEEEDEWVEGQEKEHSAATEET